ncbi:unnamed protein product [Lactuca virosa]|uniref:Enolase N-terminal domain-containing protein n=1 Tax=Lactuca virosa TaxID=75947 RepID=A0AAU9P1J6_9ASTR|nr:unnamed protein product [Lactuca virosa]
MVGGLPKVRRCKVGRLKESRPSIVSDLGVLIITHHPLHFHRSMSDFISFLCIYQTLDLRDGGLDYLGKGVSKVASNVNTIIDPAIVGNDPTDQTGTDNYMVQKHDETKNEIQRLADMKRLAYMNKTILAPCVLLNRPTKLVWVIIMDRVTVKIMSCSCKMADITDEGVSLVEQIHKRRQPVPSMDVAVYYIQPTKENLHFLLANMAGKVPLYKEVYVFFSSSVSKELVADIKKEPSIKSRLRGMKEMNLEYFAIHSQCFITDHGSALEELYGDEEFSRKGDECVTAMANRIATVFASMLEFPFVRYRAAKSLDPKTMTAFCDLIPTKLVAAVWNNLMKYKTLNHFPQIETCDLLISILK